MAQMFYVEISISKGSTFYYNLKADLNKDVIEAVEKRLGMKIDDNFKAQIERTRLDQSRGVITDRGPSDWGMIARLGDELQVASARDMMGIASVVNKEFAEEIASLANYYCPIETGNLRNSQRIEYNSDGTCTIVYDCPYAWYVHELTWKFHAYPTRAKFLEDAIRVVYAKHNMLA